MVSFVIYGEPASKANSRRVVRIAGVMRSIKSQKALGWLARAYLQIPQLDPLMTGDVSVSMTIHYATRRPDLDESLVLDAMQGRIYKNDRQVKEKIIRWGLDRTNPRAEITVRFLGANELLAFFSEDENVGINKDNPHFKYIEYFNKRKI